MFATKMAAPVLVKPDKGASVPYNGVKMQWLPVTKADSYTVQVSKDNQFKNIVFEGASDNATSHMITTLEYGLSYYWRVMASNDSNSGYWSEIRSFTTSLEAATLISPEDYSLNVLLPVEFKWDAPKIATKFHFQLAKDAGFAGIVEEDTTTEKSKTIGDLEYGSYFWRVRFLADTLAGSWSEAWTFTTNFGFAILIAPEKDAKNVSIYSVMKWDAPKGAAVFHLQIAKDEGFTDIVVNLDNLTKKEYDLFNASLVPATTYYWRIRIILDGEPGLWTETWRFTAGIDRASLLKPDDGAQNQPLEMLFKWAPINGAEYYQLQLAQDAEFAMNLKDFDHIEAAEYTAKLDSGVVYHWRVRGRYEGGEGSWSKVWTFKTAGTSGVDDNNDYVKGLIAFPNPFKVYADVQYELVYPAQVTIKIVDIFGKQTALLKNEWQGAGMQTLRWQPAGISSGAYFIIINTGNIRIVKRLIYQR
jgi:hypothetical protein